MKYQKKLKQKFIKTSHHKKDFKTEEIEKK